MNISTSIKLFLLFLSSTLLPGTLFGQNYTVNGTVTCEETGESLVGVNIFLPGINIGITSNHQGYYSLTLPAGEHTLVFSFVGYKSIQKSIKLDQDITIDLFLEKTSIELDEVVITSGRPGRNVNRTEMGIIERDIASIRSLPSFLGEVDVLKTLQLMPGVHSAGDGNTGFFVRGGDADQNLVLYDNSVIYNPSHLFNFFSVFNPDAIADLKLYKGGIPPSYGGRLSSVLDVNMKTGNMDKYEVNGGIGLISSRLSLEGPIQRGRSSFMFAGRRTYADLFLKFSPDKLQRNTQLYFYDLNGKLNYRLNERNEIHLSGYFGRDITAFRDLFAFDWGNLLASMGWMHRFSPRFVGNLSLMYSDYSFNIWGNADPVTFDWQSEIGNLNLQTDFEFNADNNNKISFGLGSMFHKLVPGTIITGFDDDPSSGRELSSSYALEHGAYFFNEHRLWNNAVSFDYGLRLSMFQLTGPGRQYELDRSNPSEWHISDTVFLDKGVIYDQFHNWEPRINLRVSTGPGSAVKAGFTRMTQYIQQAQSSQSIAPYDAWYMSSNNIPPQSVNQVVLGFFRDFLSGLMEASIEAYYKDFRNLSDVIDNGNILGNEFLETQLRIGNGWSYGYEFLVQGGSERFDGFIGYTWSKTKRKIEGINRGKSYFSPNDRRHDISLSGSYAITPRISMAMNFVYSSGRAYTYPVGKMRYQGETVPIFADRNSSNLPDYHRLDFSMTYSRGRTERNRFRSEWNISVFNAYGRINPISVSFKRNPDPEMGPSKSSFFYIPGPIPSVTWNFSF